VVGHAGEIAVGEDSPVDTHRPWAVASCRHRSVYEQKNPGAAAARAILAGDGCLGPERCFYSTLPRLLGIGIPQPITSPSNLEAAHRLSATAESLRLPGTGWSAASWILVVNPSPELPSAPPAGFLSFNVAPVAVASAALAPVRGRALIHPHHLWSPFQPSTSSDWPGVVAAQLSRIDALGAPLIRIHRTS
jgi:hypothetical protein